MHGATIWLGNDPYLFLPCYSIFCITFAEEDISGICFPGLSKEDWKDYGLSRAGVVAVSRLQEMVKAAQIEASHVSGR